jgi:alpha-D-ribose 1-methylphosphonate 5-triphosphate synthase subunit PhnH
MTAVSDATADAIVAARLSPHESQLVFRRVLDALARPGRLAWLPADVVRRVPPAFIPALALCDLEVTHCVVDDPWWGAVVEAATGSRGAPVDEASWVVTKRALTPDDVASLVRGTAHAPERGTRLVHSCRELHMGAGDQPWSSTEAGASIMTVEVSGPGVPQVRRFTVTGLHRQFFDALSHANRGFPAGVDTWLVADSGAVIGLPRTTRIDVVDCTTRGEH